MPSPAPTAPPTTWDQSEHAAKVKADLKKQKDALEAHAAKAKAAWNKQKEEFDAKMSKRSKEVEAAMAKRRKELDTRHTKLQKHLGSQFKAHESRIARLEKVTKILDKEEKEVEKEVESLKTPSPTTTPSSSPFNGAMHVALKGINNALEKIAAEMAKPKPPVSIDHSPAAQWALKYGAVAGPLSLPQEESGV